MMRKRGLIIAGVLVLFISGMLFFNHNKGQTHEDQPAISSVAEEHGDDKQVNGNSIDMDIGKPSEGTTHIEQEIISENPYSNTDKQAAINFSKTKEGQLIATLFDNLDNPAVTKISGDLAGLTLGEVYLNTTITKDFEGILWGYRFQDSKDRFLYDGNILKNFQPHNDLLEYLQKVRPNIEARAERVGMIIPEWGTGGSSLTTLKVDGQERSYLLQRMKGSLLISQKNVDGLKYYVASYNMAVAAPREEGAQSLPYYIWYQDLKVDLDPIKDSDLNQVKSRYFVE